MVMVEFLGVFAGLSVDPTMMQVSIHEDNKGALVLVDMIPSHFTPRSKTFDTIEEIGDLFTKDLPTKNFKY